MTWVAVGVGVVGAVGSFMGGRSQKKAAEEALRRQEMIDQRNQSALDPFKGYGVRSAAALQSMLGFGSFDPSGAWHQNKAGFDPNSPLLKQFSLSDFQASPAYQFNLQQGQQAIDKAAAARGMTYAPQTLQDISKFSQGLASNEFQNALGNYRNWQGDVFSRLSGGVNTGLSAANSLVNAGQGYAQGASQTLGQLGNVQAGQISGIFGNVLGGLGQGYNNYQQNQMLEQLQAQQAGQFGGYNPGTGLSTVY